MSAIKTTFIYSLTIAFLSVILLLTCAGAIVKACIDDPMTVEYGGRFQRIICVTCPCVSVTMIVITLFQAAGKKVQPLVLSLLRKGGLDIPAMLLMNRWIGINGVAWATPIADFTAMLIAIGLFIPFWMDLSTGIGNIAEV